jgi:hypothetical protein
MTEPFTLKPSPSAAMSIEQPDPDDDCDQWDERDDYDVEDDDDELVMFCGTPGCLEIGLHSRDECCTVEHIEAYERYHHPRWWYRIQDFFCSLPHRLKYWWTRRGEQSNNSDDLPF